MWLRPLELIHFAVAVCLLAIIVVSAATNRLQDWYTPLLCWIALVVFLSVITLLSQKEETLPDWLKLFINLYPAATIPGIYEILGFLTPLTDGPDWDAWLAAMDRKLFGTDPTVWLERFTSPALTDLFYLAYASYYFFPLILGLILWWRDRFRAKEFVFSLSLSFFIIYVGYCIFPARGPLVELASKHSIVLEVTPLSRYISETIESLQYNKYDAFPSGHTMITVFCLLYSWNYEKRFFKVALIPGLLLVVATVYCRYHYVVDVIAGLLLAVGAIPLTRRCYQWLCNYKRFERSPQP